MRKARPECVVPREFDSEVTRAAPNPAQGPFQAFATSALQSPPVGTGRTGIELAPGDIVTDPRSQAYYIVTEYGGVNLVGCSTWERAEKLISIAHPMFRDELIANAEKQGIWIKSNKR